MIMKEKVIITHSGNFHADEIIACIILSELHPNTKIIRTRDMDVLENLINMNEYIAVVDVYRCYNHTKRLYDHHQRGFDETYKNYKTKLSSAGLIYKHYGEEFIKKFIPYIEQRHMNIMLNKIYMEYIQSIDATDNGITSTSEIYYRTLDDIVKSFYNVGSEEESFMMALKYIKEDVIRYMVTQEKWYSNYRVGFEFMKNHLNDEIVIANDITDLDLIMPWIELELKTQAKFIIKKGTDGFRAYAVVVKPFSFEMKKQFKKEWCGLSNSDLQRVVGRKDVKFVHHNGFLAISRSLNSLLYMCNLSLNN